MPRRRRGALSRSLFGLDFCTPCAVPTPLVVLSPPQRYFTDISLSAAVEPLTCAAAAAAAVHHFVAEAGTAASFRN